MAISTTMQSILASPVMTQVSSRTRLNQLVPTKYAARLQRPRLLVRSMAEDDQKDEATPVKAASPPSTPSPNPNPTSKVSTKFSDLFAFSGPAPERINGRLAMVGFVAALGAELASGEDVISQITNGGIPWFLGTSILFSIASLVPLLRGVTVQSKSEGLMTSDAELWNGRFAMLGLVALALTEYLKGGALV